MTAPVRWLLRRCTALRVWGRKHPGPYVALVGAVLALGVVPRELMRHTVPGGLLVAAVEGGSFVTRVVTAFSS